jgi:hypothetical protein
MTESLAFITTPEAFVLVLLCLALTLCMFLEFRMEVRESRRLRRSRKEFKGSRK